MKQNPEKDKEILSQPSVQNCLKESLRKKWFRISLVSLLGLVLLAGVFYAGLKVASQKESSRNSQSLPQITSNPSTAPTESPSSQEAEKPVVNQKTPLTPPDKFEFTKLYRWSNTRKTAWEDSSLGLKITTPEWTESRYARESDADGKFTYTDWARIYPEAKTYDSSYFSENIKRVEITGAYVSSQYLSILSSKYQGKTFSEIANELLIPAGFCTTEWKSSKAECASSDYCYTRNEVMQNLIVKKQIKIGALDAQLRNMNQDFSNKNDCRAEDTWLIKAKNGLFILSNISPDTEAIRLEGI